jgi:hypothetical protein
MCDTKKCVTCKEAKPVTDFSRNKARNDGLQATCRACNKEYQREHYLKNKESILNRHAIYRETHKEEIRAWQHDYQLANKERISAYHALYGELNKDTLRKKNSEWGRIRTEKIRSGLAPKRQIPLEKARAYSQVAAAISAGLLPQPKSCSLCDSTEKLEYHHEDYSKPLEVVELCHKCHMRLHANRPR